MQNNWESHTVQFQDGQSQNQFMMVPKPTELKKQQSQDLVYSGPFQQYFSSKMNQTTKGTNMNSKYNSIIQKKLHQQLLDGKTNISKKKKVLVTPAIQKSEQKCMDQEKMIINKRKVRIAQELKEVLREEGELARKYASLNRSQSKSRIISWMKSNQSKVNNPEWKQQILQAIKRNREFQLQLFKKSQDVRRQFQEFNFEKMKKERQKLEEIRQKSIKQLTQRKIRSESLKNMFVKSQSQCASIVRKLRPQKYRFQAMQKSRQQLKKQLQMEKIERLKQQMSLIKSKKIWQDIKQHQQSYIWRLKQRREQWINNFQQKNSSIKQNNKLYQSIFVDRILAEDFKQKVQKEEAKKRATKQLQKVKKYSQYILDHFKPKSTHNFQKTLVTPEKLRHSLTFFERRVKGLQYLSLAKKTAKTPEPSDLQANKKVSSLPVIKHASLYKDYLRQQPKRSTNTTSFSEFQNRITAQRGDWKHEAFALIQKMQSMQTLHRDKPLIQCVNNKLQLLQAML